MHLFLWVMSLTRKRTELLFMEEKFKWQLCQILQKDAELQKNCVIPELTALNCAALSDQTGQRL